MQPDLANQKNRAHTNFGGEKLGKIAQHPTKVPQNPIKTRQIHTILDGHDDDISK